VPKVIITFHERHDNKEKIYDNAEAEEDYASQRLGVYRVDPNGKRGQQIAGYEFRDIRFWETIED
jgi:hypothetical protein